MDVATLIRHPPRPRDAVPREHVGCQAQRVADAVLTALARVQPLVDPWWVRISY
ncbi:hypothetical protein J2W56_001037 [Nocardia kruczakiae]|uniref:Uncharacterized protein n=1 Tax=Nocardia kruczakiae TaxID=261477 RepID=A0ABU1XA38_9NOCA|nr:hypothetical protein [Nocardia kruczakiae]MDR7167319.1 hypothetical protein [Nocardia kruczakiae]